MVQKKLPLINSAHGSDTRNIINELIKLFNGMGYTYNESLQKAHDVLNEAKQTNDMNKDVQNQLDNLIIESGNANAEVSQARGGLPLLNDRLDESDEKLAQTVNEVYLKSYPRLTDETDDTNRLQRALNDVKGNGAKIIIEDSVLTISSDLICDFYIHLEGVNSGFTNQWGGKKTFPKIKYTGSGTFLKVDGRNVTTERNAISGLTLKNIWLEGTENGYCGVSINDDGLEGATATRSIIMDNVQITGFTRGYAYRIFHSYSNRFINCSFQINAVNGYLEECYATDYVSCIKEDSYVNLYTNKCPQVNFIGGTNEAAYLTSTRYTMPSDFPIWNGWDVGTGETQPIEHIRNKVSDYQGIGVVNFGSSVYVNGTYFEANDHHFIGELSSFTSVQNSTFDLTTTSRNKTLMNIASGRVLINNCYVRGGSFSESMVYCDRAYIAQVTITDVYGINEDNLIGGHSNVVARITNGDVLSPKKLSTEEISTKEIITNSLIETSPDKVVVNSGVGGVTINNLNGFVLIELIGGSGIQIQESGNYPLNEGQSFKIIIHSTKTDSIPVTFNGLNFVATEGITVPAGGVVQLTCTKYSDKIYCSL